MNPLNSIEKAKEWVDNLAKTYSNGQCFCVCKWNEGYIVHSSNFIKEHFKEYESGEVVYCTDAYVFQQINTLIRIDKI
jgi:hypothetical protein